MVGDYGLFSDPPTEANNYKIAQVMSKVAQEDSVDFLVAAGDNFYSPSGINSTDDPRIKTRTDITYNQPGIADKPWYFVLGNHDCDGNPEDEIALNGKVSNWNFPSSYYSKTFSIDSKGNKALFLFLDGCLLTWMAADEETKKTFSFTPTEEAIETQTRWIKDTLENAAKDDTIIWRSIVVHWPFFSIGKSHGDTEILKLTLLKTLFENKVDVVLSGHDHAIQYIRMTRNNFEQHGYRLQSKTTNHCEITTIGLESNPTITMKQGDALHQIVSGNGGDSIYELCSDRVTKYEEVVFAASTYGFVDIRMSATKFEIRNYLLQDQGTWNGRLIIERSE